MALVLLLILLNKVLWKVVRVNPEFMVATAAGAVTWNYGLFANNVIKFLLTSIVIFFIVKGPL